MYSSKSNTAQAMEILNDSSALDEHASKVASKVASKSLDVNYPFSFLLLESEEDSFVKGYN